MVERVVSGGSPRMTSENGWFAVENVPGYMLVMWERVV